MISLNLSTVQENAAASAGLAAAMEAFERNGGVIQRLEVTTLTPPPFNNEVIAPSAKVSKAVNIQKSAKAAEYERNIAEKLRAYIDLGIAAAAKDLGLGVKRLTHIATNYSIEFTTGTGPAAMSKAAARRRELAPQVKELANQKLSQEAIAKQMGITRQTVRTIAKENDFTVRISDLKEDEVRTVERIKAIRDIGCSQSECCRKIGMSHNKLRRLMLDHEFDYPIVARLK
jgi:transcriptional regulator with XRE-family HTH domain